MVIRLGNGLDGLYFGMMISEVVELIGEPDKINEEERDEHIVYYYNALMIKLFFCTDYDNKLLAIEVFNSDAVLYGEKIIGLQKNEIEKLLDKNNIISRCYEDYDYFEVIFCEEIWSIFCFEYNRLKSVECSVLSDEDNNLIWPEIPSI